MPFKVEPLRWLRSSRWPFHQILLLALSVAFNLYLLKSPAHGQESSLAHIVGNGFSAAGDVATLKDADVEPTWRRLTGSSSSSSSSSSSTTSSNSSPVATCPGGRDYEVGTSSGAASGAASGSAAGSSGGGHHAHQYDAMLFLFDAFVVGAAVMHLLTKMPQLQETVVLFVLGMLFSLVLEGLNFKNRIGVFGESYNMWMDIDPHTLLFTMLPALLAGDAMSIDTSVAKRVGFQCLYLAGPGVLYQAFCAAAFLHLFLGWSFLLSLTTAAMLCATDPVAVVALLKELGASPVLTVQIQGESLLNDGTAIVLYMVSYAMLSGEEMDGIDMLMFLVEKAFLAWGMGMFIGYFFFTWIRLAGNKLEHHSDMIQIILTLCSAYWSFIMAEGVMGWSGVLATVASSLVLAHHMWPHIVSPDSLHHFWHTIEALGNIILFFLAGALTGNVMVHIDPIEYLNLLVIYLVLLVIRGSLLFGSRPLMKFLSADRQEVTWQDCCVMTWGGLRGAVGLALAIQVFVGRAREGNCYNITEKEAKQVFFFTAGVALLTTLINATTCPAIVNYLEITALPRSQQTLLKFLNQQLKQWSVNSSYPGPVTKGLEHMIEEIEHHIMGQKVAKSVAASETKPGEKVIAEYKDSLKEFEALTSNKEKGALVQLLGELPEINFMGKVDTMIELVQNHPADGSMSKAVNRAFMHIVRSKYDKQILAANLRAGSPETEVLLMSVRVALSPLDPELKDYDLVDGYVEKHMKILAPTGEAWWKVLPTDSDALTRQASSFKADGVRGTLRKFVSSSAFNGFIAVCIILNGVYVAVDELARNEENQFDVGWLVIEGIFTVVFMLEFLFKLVVYRKKFFLDNWNNFDCVLAWLGLLGFIMSCELSRTKAADSDSAELLRLSRVFRLLRFLRAIRLLNSQIGQEQMSQALAARIHRIETWYQFVHAHLSAEIALVKYFGGNGQVDEKEEVEIARCILQSQTAVYKAFNAAVAVMSELDKNMIQELKWVKKRKQITESLEEFVMHALEDGAISTRETESILHPMHHHLADCLKEFEKFEMGLEGSLKAQIKDSNSKVMGLLGMADHGHGHGHGGGDGHGHGGDAGHGHAENDVPKPESQEIVPPATEVVPMGADDPVAK